MISTECVRQSLACAFTLTDVKHLHEALRTLQARLDAGEARPAPRGVCSALARILTPYAGGPGPYLFVHLAVEDWPEAIRNEDGAAADYPVSTAGGFWVGENRAARIRLISHLTQHCEALLAYALA